MTPEQAAAFVLSQTALLNAEVAGMLAENDYRLHRGETVAYRDEDFEEVRQKYQLGYNAVQQIFREANQR